jgi:ribosomal protein S12 methylthiotransferase accessory factor
MLTKVAALINGRRTVLDIVRAFGGIASSQNIFHMLYLLSDWGLISVSDMDPQAVIAWKCPETTAPFQALFKMCGASLRSLVSIQPDDDFPVFCYAAIPKQSESKTGKEEKSGIPGIYTLGAGFTRQAGILTALGEMTETLAANWSDDVDITHATVKEVGKNSLSPHQLLFVSNRQFQMRTYWRERYGERHRIPISAGDTDLLDWVTVTAYPDETPCLIPAGYCYLNYPRDQKYLVADSNGCAAGPTRMEAMVSGFLELVERDAVAIWWYNRIKRPAIDPAMFSDPGLNECIHWMDQQQRRFYILDLTHDYGIPVVVSISVNSENTDICMGFGANFDYLTAVQSAVREMMQVYSLKRIMERQIVSGGIESLDRSARAFISWADSNFVTTHDHMQPHGMIRALKAPEPAAAGPTGQESAWQTCVALCRQKHQQLLVLDLTQPEADVSVVRVIAAGLRSFRARFAPGRLYQVPVAMGWRTVPLSENDLIRIPILI